MELLGQREIIEKTLGFCCFFRVWGARGGGIRESFGTLDGSWGGALAPGVARRVPGSPSGPTGHPLGVVWGALGAHWGSLGPFWRPLGPQGTSPRPAEGPKALSDAPPGTPHCEKATKTCGFSMISRCPNNSKGAPPRLPETPFGPPRVPPRTPSGLPERPSRPPVSPWGILGGPGRVPGGPWGGPWASLGALGSLGGPWGDSGGPKGGLREPRGSSVGAIGAT